MGLIRKTLHFGTLGLVATRSKKQRTQAQILAATQGMHPDAVEAAGGRGLFSRDRARSWGPRNRPEFTDEERAYMADHVPAEARRKTRSERADAHIERADLIHAELTARRKARKAGEPVPDFTYKNRGTNGNLHSPVQRTTGNIPV